MHLACASQPDGAALAPLVSQPYSPFSLRKVLRTIGAWSALFLVYSRGTLPRDPGIDGITSATYFNLASGRHGEYERTVQHRSLRWDVLLDVEHNAYGDWRDVHPNLFRSCSAG